jgi:hypothetical protein
LWIEAVKSSLGYLHSEAVFANTSITIKVVIMGKETSDGLTPSAVFRCFKNGSKLKFQATKDGKKSC